MSPRFRCVCVSAACGPFHCVTRHQRDANRLSGCDARGEVAKLPCGKAPEIVWFSSATEAIDLAMKGTALARGDRGARIVAPAMERKAVPDMAAWLESQGFDVDRIRPGSDGTAAAEGLAEVLRQDTVLVSLTRVNNEIETVTTSRSSAPYPAAWSAVSHGRGAERRRASSRRYCLRGRSRSARQDLRAEGKGCLATSIAMTVGGHRTPKRPDAPSPFLEPTIYCLRFQAIERRLPSSGCQPHRRPEKRGRRAQCLVRKSAYQGACR